MLWPCDDVVCLFILGLTPLTSVFWTFMLLMTPIIGVLIRVRADYTPKVAAVYLPDSESGNEVNELMEDSPRGPFFGYLSMFVRVWRYEVSSNGERDTYSGNDLKLRVGEVISKA
jgi:hypothetical protein